MPVFAGVRFRLLLPPLSLESPYKLNCWAKSIRACSNMDRGAWQLRPRSCPPPPPAGDGGIDGRRNACLHHLAYIYPQGCAAEIEIGHGIVAVLSHCYLIHIRYTSGHPYRCQPPESVQWRGRSHSKAAQAAGFHMALSPMSDWHPGPKTRQNTDRPPVVPEL